MAQELPGDTSTPSQTRFLRLLGRSGWTAGLGHERVAPRLPWEAGRCWAVSNTGRPGSRPCGSGRCMEVQVLSREVWAPQAPGSCCLAVPPAVPSGL